jgi:hypothetical protein
MTKCIRLLTLAAVIMSVLLLVGCGGGDGGSTPTPTPTPGQFSVSPESLSLEATASGGVTNVGTVTVTASVSTIDSVNIALTGAISNNANLAGDCSGSSLQVNGTCIITVQAINVTANETGTLIISSSESGVASVEVPITVTLVVPGQAVLSVSPTSLSFSNVNSGTLTLSNTGVDTLTGLSIVTTGGPANLVTSTTCDSTTSGTIAPGRICTYTLSNKYPGVSHGTATVTITGTDTLHDVLSATVSAVVMPASGVVVEDASADISSNESLFLQDANAANVLNLIFVDTGSIDVTRTAVATSGVCALPDQYFDFYAPQVTLATTHPCVDFASLVSAYQQSPHTSIQTAIWISSTNASSTSDYGDGSVLANTIASAVNNSSAIGVAIESIFPTSSSDQDKATINLFYTTLATALQEAHKTLFIYEPTDNLPLSTLANDGNVVAVVPLYDMTDNLQTYTYRDYANALPQTIQAGAAHGGLPVLYLVPSSGQDSVWSQQLIFPYSTQVDPYNPPDQLPVGITFNSGVCDPSPPGDPTPPPCSSYTNKQTPDRQVPDGVANAQMFGYTKDALCALNPGTNPVFNTAAYSGAAYYNLRPAGFWQYAQKGVPGKVIHATYPESIEPASWEFFKDWVANVSISTFCQ